MLGKKLINAGPVSSGANTFASENFNTVLYTGNGSTQRIGGYINRGAVFNGSSSKIVLPSGSPFNDSNTIKAVSMWFRLTTTSSNLYGFSVGSDNSGSYFFNLYISGSSIGGQVRNGGSSNQSTMAATWTADTDWHHVVWQLGSTEKEIYLDGNKLSVTFTNTGTSNDTSWIDYPSYSGNVVGQIGVNRATASFSYSNGLKDQVRFFNKALSSSEVTTLYGETYASSTKSTTDIFGDGSGVALYELDDSANDTGGVNGKFGSAAIFNGSSSKITINNFNTLSTFSVSMWINANSEARDRTLFHPYNGSNINGSSIGILNTGAELFIWADDFSRYFKLSSSDTSSLLNGNWNNFTYTVNSSTTEIKVYINGSEKTLTASSVNSSLPKLNPNIKIGARWDDLSGYFFKGKIDQVRIYDTALSSSDVTNLYNETSVPTANLVAHYKLDGNALDETGIYSGTATNVTYGYDGTATNVNFLGMAFQPDLVWIKSRSAGGSHILTDSVRGDGKEIYSDLTNQEGTVNRIALDSNGFTVTATNYPNQSGSTFVSWCWKAGGTVSANNNTDGSITSTVSANQDAGFSIVKWTNTVSESSVGHGLSVKPELIIAKNLDVTSDWLVYTDVIDGSMDYLRLNTTAAKGDSGRTLPTSSVFYFASDTNDYIAYCFHSVDGYQKVGSYTGTGASGNVVTTGFQPRFIMYKRTDSTGNWVIHDSERNTTSALEARLYPNLNDAEQVVSPQDVNLLSNGFEMITTSGDGNANGGTYIYLAIA